MGNRNKKLNFLDYKNCLLNNEVILKLQESIKSEIHNVYTEKVNKIVLKGNDDKRLKTFDRITSYCYGSSPGRVCKTDTD